MYVILIPILTMRIVAEENRQKTDQLLYTSPVSISKIIVGKYLAVMTLFSAGIIIICFYPLILNMYGDDVRLASAYSSIIGFYLLGAASIAIGMFVSCLTESQIIAAVISFLVLLMSYLLTNVSAMLPSDALSQCIMFAICWLIVCGIAYYMMKNITVFTALVVIGEVVLWIIYVFKSSIYEGLFNNILNALAISARFDDFELGILNYDAIVYYVTIAFLFVFLTVQTIKNKRFN